MTRTTMTERTLRSSIFIQDTDPRFLERLKSVLLRAMSRLRTFKLSGQGEITAIIMVRVIPSHVVEEHISRLG